MRYFILLSIITHALLLGLWDTVQLKQADSPVTAHPGSPPVAVTLTGAPASQTDLHHTVTEKTEAAANQRTTSFSLTATPVPQTVVEHRKATAITTEIKTAKPSVIPQKKPLVDTTAPAAVAITQSLPTPQETRLVPAITHRDNHNQRSGADIVPTTAATEAMLQDNLARAFTPYFQYPRLARKRGWQGTVELGLHISASGELSNIRVMQSSGYRVLDRAAIRSLQQVGSLPAAKEWLTQGYNGVFPIRYELIDG